MLVANATARAENPVIFSIANLYFYDEHEFIGDQMATSPSDSTTCAQVFLINFCTCLYSCYCCGCCCWICRHCQISP